MLPQTEFGPLVTVDRSDFDDCYNFASSLPECISLLQSVLSPNWVNIKGTKYQPGMAVILKISENGAPVFGVIDIIFVCDKDVMFLYSYLLTVGFDEHAHAYEVEYSDMKSSINQEDLYDPLPLSIYHSVLGLKFIVLRHSL